MFKNLIEVTQYFSDKQRCIDYLIELRWGKGEDQLITCAHCDHDKVYELKGATKRYKCAKCRKQFSVTKGLIFENSPISLQKWFVAIYLITAHKKGISSCQLARDISVCQKTVWFMLQRIRHAYGLPIAASQENLLGGEGVIVEADTTHVGGKVKNMNNKRRKAIAAAKAIGETIENKTEVIGILERGGNVRLEVMRKDVSVQEYVTGSITLDSVLMTDAAPSFKKIGTKYATHGVTDHSKSEFVKDKVIHTNTIEGTFSLLDRMIIGIYHYVSPKHLQRYLNECAFRYNIRKTVSDAAKFQKTLTCIRTRITYKQLTEAA